MEVVTPTSFRGIDVVAAVIFADERILCARRGPGPLADLWEFPGGKIEPGETPEDALEREICEELLCRISVGERIETTSGPHPSGRPLRLTTYRCVITAGAATLTEHAELRWVLPSELLNLDWAEADIPTVQRLAGQLTTTD